MTALEIAGRTACIRAAGDTGLVLDFGNVIDTAINALVHEIDRLIWQAPPAGLVETVPSYRSLLLIFDPLVTSPDALIDVVGALAPRGAQMAPRICSIPVRYGGHYGADLEAVAARSRLSPTEVVALHAGTSYRVFMIGFAPGFAYLGGLDPRLHLPRRADPRPVTPTGSIMIGGQQTGVAALAMPSGWHLLGQTPLRTFDPRLDQPFQLAPGDEVRFRPVTEEEFIAIQARVEREPYWPQDETG